MLRPSFHFTLKLKDLRDGLDYGEISALVKNLGEWSSMIGYGMSSSLVGVYTMSKTSMVKRLRAWMTTLQHFWLGEFSRGQIYWATSNPQTKNLTSGELQLEVLLLCFHLVHHSNCCLT